MAALLRSHVLLWLGHKGAAHPVRLAKLLDCSKASLLLSLTHCICHRYLAFIVAGPGRYGRRAAYEGSFPGLLRGYVPSLVPKASVGFYIFLSLCTRTISGKRCNSTTAVLLCCYALFKLNCFIGFQVVRVDLLVTLEATCCLTSCVKRQLSFIRYIPVPYSSLRCALTGWGTGRDALSTAR